jgi:arylsulfatase A-like enzyme
MAETANGSARDRRRRLAAWCALGALAGGAVALKALDVGATRVALASEQWFRVARSLSDVLQHNVTLGLLLGLGVGMMLRRPRLPLAPLVLVLGTAVFLGTIAANVAARLRPSPEGPNVLLIVLDTTRRDHLSLHGHERATTPRLDAFAADATVYDRAYSTSGWTCSAHASMFTGLFPESHGVTQESWIVRPEHLTLAELLWEAGYRTAAIVGNPMVGRSFGFDQGFDEFHENWRAPEPDGAADHPAVRGLQRLLTSGERFFAFVNLIEPHTPYTSGPHLGAYRTHPEIELTNNHWRAFFTGRAQFGPDELEHLAQLYDGELRFTDEILGHLFDSLETAGALDETLVVVTSDHGEHFGEHGLVDHVFNLYEVNVRVPLVVRHPAAFPRARRDEPVQVHDLFPTILGLAGARVPDHQGLDLTGAIDPQRPLFLSYGHPLQAFGAIGVEGSRSPLLDPYRRRLYALRAGDHKLIVGDDGREELYDLARDPDEDEDLAGTPAGDALIDGLRTELRELAARYRRIGPVPAAPAGGAALDAETLEALRDLGYAE